MSNSMLVLLSTCIGALIGGVLPEITRLLFSKPKERRELKAKFWSSCYYFHKLLPKYLEYYNMQRYFAAFIDKLSLIEPVSKELLRDIENKRAYINEYFALAESSSDKLMHHESTMLSLLADVQSLYSAKTYSKVKKMLIQTLALSNSASWELEDFHSFDIDFFHRGRPDRAKIDLQLKRFHAVQIDAFDKLESLL